MTPTETKWLRVSREMPCPVCEKPEWCLVAPDGSAAICARIESAKRCGEAGWLHRRAEPVKGAPPPKCNPAGPPKDWPALAAKFAANLDADRRKELAAKLGLPADALDALPLLGFSPDDSRGPCFTFAEMDAAGNVVGLNRRYCDGSKKAMAGSKRGLTLPTGWRDRPGPVFVVEGPTDAAALTAAGLAAVGRPSNAGGVKLLAALVRDRDADRDILIVGENDQKDAGAWPGRAGALSVARGLSALLRRSIRWALPPADAKDVRDWLTADARAAVPWDQRGADLRDHLTGTAATVDPLADTPAGSGGRTPPAGPNDGPDNPHRLAGGFLDGIAPAGSPRLLRFWRGEFHRYRAGAYRPVPDDDQRGELTACVRSEFLRVNETEGAAWRTSEGKDKGKPPRVRPVTCRLIGDVLQALRGLCLLPASTDAPAWIDGATGPDPAGLLPLRNGILDLGALAARRAECLLPSTPLFFTPTVAPFDFDPNAPRPVEWLKFLGEVWPDDPESIDTLQEWFGYLLTPDTRQQKMLFLLGPKRSGKGTIARVLRELVGTANVAGPTFGSLSTNFGLSPLIGKSVALVSDARLSGRSDSAVITERLLSISGEDALTIDRKFRDPLTVKLNARFVILSNELPRLGDASGALAGRLILLRLTRSWFGEEDTHLFDRLKGALPGILLWAVEGWRRLQERGRFLQPKSAAKLVEEMEDLSSPVGAFVRERCRVGSGERVEVCDLYAAWRSWCDVHGRKEPGTEETFGRDLRAAVPALDKTRPRTPEGRLYVYTGIRLRRDSDPDSDTEPAPSGRPGPRGRRDHALYVSAENGVEGARGAHAEEECNGVVDTMAGHGDHVDQGDQPRPRRRFANDDTPHERRD